jgi:hypothetical protein
MLIPFAGKVTGWFTINWSPEFPVGEVRPLRPPTSCSRLG